MEDGGCSFKMIFTENLIKFYSCELVTVQDVTNNCDSGNFYNGGDNLEALCKLDTFYA